MSQNKYGTLCYPLVSWGGQSDLDYGINPSHELIAEDKAQQRSNKPQNDREIIT